MVSRMSGWRGRPHIRRRRECVGHPLRTDTGLDGPRWKVFADGIRGFGIGDCLIWLRLFEFYSFEIRRRDLECVEQEAGGFAF
jgi:hypothetical protein